MPRWAPGPLGHILQEGLAIVGWVAMWKPLEIYLYDWWPLRMEWRDLQRLARMRVRLLPPNRNAHYLRNVVPNDVTAEELVTVAVEKGLLPA